MRLIMPKDVLLIRSNHYHLAVPTERLLEIVNLNEYHAEQQINLKMKETSHNPDQYRLWRNHLLPVVHLAHFISPETKKSDCAFGLVYQASDRERLYLDTDHVFGITHIDTSQMKPIYASKETKLKAEKNILAFFLEENTRR